MDTAYKTPFPWTCPYCNRDVIVNDDMLSKESHSFDKNNKDGLLSLRSIIIVCPNPKCREYTIIMYLHPILMDGFKRTYENKNVVIAKWNLRPQSNAKPFPDYIPKPIIDDYNEACLIKELSPKASATLSRRCLQGMIRDFWGIKKSRLVDEISELKDKIDNETWETIDGVRTIGNIGAHMEKDINLITDVEPQEAELLIELIESLIKEWYIAKHDRAERNRLIREAAKRNGKKDESLIDEITK